MILLLVSYIENLKMLPSENDLLRWNDATQGPFQTPHFHILIVRRINILLRNDMYNFTGAFDAVVGALF